MGMTTIPIEAEVSAEQLLRAVEQLPSQDLATFVTRLLALRAQREEPHVSQPETTLLLQVNEGIPIETRRRFDALIAKRQGEAITSEELAELIEITEEIERRDAQRLAALQELAQLRRMPLTDLLDDLGIAPPPYA